MSFLQAYPDSCIAWGSWISNSKPMGRFKDDLEPMDLLLAQTNNCRNPVAIKCVTNGYQSEVKSVAGAASLTVIISKKYFWIYFLYLWGFPSKYLRVIGAWGSGG